MNEKIKKNINKYAVYLGLAAMLLAAVLFIRYCGDALRDRIGTPLPTQYIALSDMDLYTIKPLTQTGEDILDNDLITLIATLSYNIGGPHGEPVGLYNALKSAQGLDEGGHVRLEKIQGLTFVIEKEPDGEYIENCMLSGNYPMLETLVQGKSHWVLVVGTDMDKKNFLVYDPKQAETYALGAGNAIGRCITLKLAQ